MRVCSRGFTRLSVALSSNYHVMNKNIVIGSAVVLVLIALGAAISAKNSPPGTGILSYVNQNGILPSDTTPVATHAPNADAPTVETSSDVVSSNSTAIVSGQVKPNGSATTYWFDYGETTGLTDRSTVQAIGSGFCFTPAAAYITGLRPNVRYYFRLSAKNAVATVNGATYNFLTNSNPPPTTNGVAPTTNTAPAEAISRTTVNIKGEVNSNGEPTKFWFEYGKDPGLGNVTALESTGGGVVPVAVSVSLSNLDPLTKYYFRLNAQNQYGTVNGSILSFTTTGPESPGKPRVDTTLPAEVTSSTTMLTGRVTPGGAETKYWFEYSEDSLLGNIFGSGTTTKLMTGNVDSAVDATVRDLRANTKYFYRIVAKNQYGTTFGDIVSFSTKQ